MIGMGCQTVQWQLLRHATRAVSGCGSVSKPLCHPLLLVLRCEISLGDNEGSGVLQAAAVEGRLSSSEGENGTHRKQAEGSRRAAAPHLARAVGTTQTVCGAG